MIYAGILPERSTFLRGADLTPRFCYSQRKNPDENPLSLTPILFYNMRIMQLSETYQGITIDSDTTKDIDDAVWCETASDGSILVTVFVTEITDAVPINSPLDAAALQQGATLYMNNRAFKPMLPRRISENEGSLFPKLARRALAVKLYFETGTLDLMNTGISLVDFQSLGRYNFRQAAQLVLQRSIDGEGKRSEDPVAGALSRLAAITNSLAEKRRCVGAFCRTAIADGWAVTEDMEIVRLAASERNIGYLMVQELAILANRIICEAALDNKIPFLYRNHEFHRVASATSEDAAFRHLLSAELRRAVASETGPELKSFAAVLKQIRSGLVPRRALYSPEVQGHVGLALDVYGHNTSPLRRYADLVNQRQLVAFLTEKSFPYDESALQKIGDHLNRVSDARRQVKKDSCDQSRDRKRVRLIKQSGDTARTREITMEFAGMTDGEFMKTSAIWLKILDAGELTENAAHLLLENLNRKIADDTLQPKLAVILLTHTMIDAPRRKSRATERTPADLNLRIAEILLRWMARQPAMALQAWQIAEQIYPNSGWVLPQYSTAISTESHNLFYCTATINTSDGPVTAGGSGAQKQAARAAAAFNLWVKLFGLRSDDFVSAQPVLTTERRKTIGADELRIIFGEMEYHYQAGNFKGALFELAVLTSAPVPVLATFEQKSKTPLFLARANFSFIERELESEALAASKKKAEHQAARRILAQIAGSLGDADFDDEYPPDELSPPVIVPPDDRSIARQKFPVVTDDNYIGAIDTFYRRIKIRLPKYQGIPALEDAQGKTWTVQVTAAFQNETHDISARGETLKQAKQTAAQNLYQKIADTLQITPPDLI